MGAVASACLHPDHNYSLSFVWAGRGAMALEEAPQGNQQGAQQAGAWPLPSSGDLTEVWESCPQTQRALTFQSLCNRLQLLPPPGRVFKATEFLIKSLLMEAFSSASLFKYSLST